MTTYGSRPGRALPTIPSSASVSGSAVLTPAATSRSRVSRSGATTVTSSSLGFSPADHLTVRGDRQVLVPVAHRQQDREMAGPERVDGSALGWSGRCREALVPEGVPREGLVADADPTGVVLRREEPHGVVRAGEHGERAHPREELVVRADQRRGNLGGTGPQRFLTDPSRSHKHGGRVEVEAHGHMLGGRHHARQRHHEACPTGRAGLDLDAPAVQPDGVGDDREPEP